MALWCVVPAAGRGLRAGGSTPKQYLALNNFTVMQCTLNRLSELECAEIVVPIAAHDTLAATLAYKNSAQIRFVQGGAERADSVLAGLNAIAHRAADDDWVLVHDVARPCVRVSDIQQLLQCITHSSVGGLLANPVRDTMKRGATAEKHSAPQVHETIAREQLWHALTPQIFRYGLLLRALQTAQKNNITVTDEAQAIELLGEQPLLLESARDNIKITWPDDIKLAQFFLQQQQTACD